MMEARRVSRRVTLHRIALRYWPKQLGRSFGLQSLAKLLYAQYEFQGAISDLGEALALDRSILALRPQGHPSRAVALNNLASSLYSRFNQLGAQSDLDEALVLQRSALMLCPQGHPDRAMVLGNLTVFLHSRFAQLGTLSDLDEALEFARSALELCPQGHPNRPHSLGNVALCLYSRFTQLGTLSDIDEALTLERNALELFPHDHPERAYSLGNITSILYSRFTQLGILSDLNEALAFACSALELRPRGNPYRATSLENVASILYSRFTQLGILSDLDEALAFGRSALELRPQGNPHRPTSLGNVANTLYSRFTQLGTPSDLDEALTLERSALELCPQGHPHRPTSLRNIAFYLYSRFTQLGTLSDLDEAITLERNVLELLPQGHAHRTTSLGHIADCLHSRFMQLGMLSDLDDALGFARSALELRSQGHPDRAASLGQLASCLHSRFTLHGTLSDLDEALTLERSALELHPRGHSHRATSLSRLSIYYHSRFTRLETLDDLDEALSLERSALGLRPQGHPDRVYSLGNVAQYLHVRFTQLRTLSDLEEALTLERKVLELLPPGHPDRATALGHIASCLHSRFTQLGKVSDLDEALAHERISLELRPQGNPYRSFSLGQIAFYLYSRFIQLGALDDLDEAIALARNVMEFTSEGHPDQVRSLGRLATYFFARSRHPDTHDGRDLEESFNLYSQISQISQTVSSADLSFVRSWIQAAEGCKHSTTVLAYETFLRLSIHHLATLPSLPQHFALIKRITTSTAADAFSACVRYGSLANAVELLEQGRGVFWSQLVRLRSPLEDVIASGDTGKKLAEKFTHVASLLRTVLENPPDAGSQHDRAFHLNIQLQDIVSEIRNLPGLSRFLRPPLFSDLRNAASGGPVIITNASQYSCDALIVLSDKDPIHVPLPITDSHISALSLEFRSLTYRAKFDEMTTEILVFLRELWDVVVFPVVTVLQQHCPRGSRIWWCPTAEFSLLPLHAAGSFRKGQPMLSDLYISSYTPTLTALIRARQKRSLDSSIERHRSLVVGQAQALGQCELVSVNTELSTVSRHIGARSTLTCIQDRDATIANVSRALEHNEFVHLACHGILDQKRPFESGFALGDGLLKVENIMRYDLRNAQFAYLSACHTTVGDEESPDEEIHLAAAMQFAGFRSVIGTMLAVDDAHTNEITSKFYGHMVDESGRLDYTRAALALHRTTRSLRSSGISWDQRILYVHIGA